MLRYIVFIVLYSFTEWLWAGSCNTAVGCPVKSVKKPSCPLQKKLYLDLGMSKLFNTHLSSAQTSPVDIDKDSIHFGVYPAHRKTGIFLNTIKIGMGYAWFRNAVNGGLLPYVSVGIEYRQMNPMHLPLTLTAKVFSERKVESGNNSGDNEVEESSVPNYSAGKKDGDWEIAYKSIPLQNSHLFATVKMNPFRIGCVFPYVSAGLGISWTQAHDQQLNISGITGKEKQAGRIQLPVIKQTNLGFRLGSGLDFALSKNLFMSIGYSYNNLGKLTVRKPRTCLNFEEKGLRKISYAFRTLHLGSLTTHNLEFSLRYLFP